HRADRQCRQDDLALPPRADRLGGPAGRRAEALLQRDSDQDQLALSALRFRSRRDEGHRLPGERSQLRPLDFRLDPHPGDEESLVHAEPVLLRRDRHRQARLRVSRLGLPFGRFLMLPENLTAIVARNETWTGDSATEPYEAGWAKEVVVFVRAVKEPIGALPKARIEISADGMHWAPEGSE